MNNISFALTKNEHEVMEVMWEQGRALSRTEIIKLSTNPSWKKSSIHILLNSLLEKKAIKVDGYVRTGKNYGRTYSAAITWGKYQVIQLKQELSYINSKSSAISCFISEIIMDDDIGDEAFDKMASVLQERTNEKRG